MRFIDNFSLFDLTNYMTEKEFGLCVLNGKLEAFSLIKPPIVNLVEDILVKKEAGSHCCAIHPTLSSSTDATFRKHQPEVAASSTKKVICKSAGKVKNRIPFCRPAMHPPRSRSSTVSIYNYPIRKTLRGRAASLGDLSEPSSRRLLYDLISTLDDFFPDYDFDTTKPEQFLIKDVNQLIQTVNGHLAELTEDRPDFLEKLWRSVDDIINLRKCEAFSLVPDMSEDPFSDGTLWSFNYFLFNHDMKQLIYFTCVAKSIFRRDDDMDFNLSEDDDEDQDKERVDDSGAMDLNSDDDEEDPHISGACDSLDEDDSPDWDGII